jgi:hypothetical protein
MMPKVIVPVLALAALLLTACDDPPKDKPRADPYASCWPQGN